MQERGDSEDFVFRTSEVELFDMQDSCDTKPYMVLKKEQEFAVPL